MDILGDWRFEEEFSNRVETNILKVYCFVLFWVLCEGSVKQVS